MELIGKAAIHPLWFYSGKVCGYATWISTILAWFGVGILHGARHEGMRLLALALWGAGLLLSGISMLHLGASTRLGLPATLTAFKTHGIYRFSRNPMYLGFDLLTLGAIAYQLHAVVAILGIYSIVIYHFIIQGEEKFLRERFGAEYLGYMSRVRRYM